MMFCRFSVAFIFPIVFSTLLTACGSGGSGDSQPHGSLAIAEADADHDGLIEIATLEQLDWIRNDPAGKSLTDFDNQVNSKGCPDSGCVGYELVADLDFDTNGDGSLDKDDTYFDYEKNGSNAGWKPLPQFTGSFEGNGHHIKNLFINRRDQASVGLFSSLANGDTTSSFRNIHFDGNLSRIDGGGNVGALAGELVVWGTTEITNIIVDLGSFSGVGAVGGVVGKITSDGDLTIDSNSVAGIVGSSGAIGGPADAIYPYSADETLASSSGVAGGLVGSINHKYDGGPITISNNSSTANVSGETVGGLIGDLSAADAALTTVERNSTLEKFGIFGRSSAGGLFGSVSGANVVIRDSFSKSNVFAGTRSGGLIGVLAITGGSVSNVYASGFVMGDADVGGLIGELACSDTVFVEESHASGGTSQSSGDDRRGISEGFAGGLIGVVHAPVSGSCGIRRSYASGSVTGNHASGGLIGLVDSANNYVVQAATVVLSDSISAPSILAEWAAGGLVGSVRLYGGSLFVADKNLVLGEVQADPEQFFGNTGGGLAGEVTLGATSTATFSFNYWASDTTAVSSAIAVTSPSVTETGNLSATRAELECAVVANDTFCTSGELFHGWETSVNSLGQPVWDFGDTAQLPGLIVGSAVERPSYYANRYWFATDNP